MKARLFLYVLFGVGACLLELRGCGRAWCVSDAGAVKITAVFLPAKHNCTINYYSGNTHVSWVVWSQLGCCCSVISPGAHSSVLIKSSWQRSCVVINSSLARVSPQHSWRGWILLQIAQYTSLLPVWLLLVLLLLIFTRLCFFSAIECISLCQVTNTWTPGTGADNASNHE